MKIRATLEIPDRSITRAKLEHPTEDVSFAYLSSINMVVYSSIFIGFIGGYVTLARNSFTDKAVWQAVQSNNHPILIARLQDYQNSYFNYYNLGAVATDHELLKIENGTLAWLASEAVDLDNRGRGLTVSCSGSVIKSLRYEMTTPVNPLALPAPTATISATDTTFASGLFGHRFIRAWHPHGGGESDSAWLKAPMTPLPPALSIIEVEVEGDGTPENPYRPSLQTNLVEIAHLTGLPEHLYREAKKYEVLRAKGFTDDEIQLLLGSIPQHQVDLEAVTWGVFEFNKDSPTNIIVVTGDNPYREGAVERQAELARSKNLETLKPPRSYDEAAAQFNQLKRDYPHWLAGKDNYAYQVLGLEELDLFQNVDFYHGELIEHKTHYQQLRQVPDFEMWRRLEELEGRLERITILTEERDKHMAKLKEVKRLGW
jgi:hypothetical protein